jgi:hypothetical protein
MNLEVVGVVLSAATLVVIGATAIAAIVQLRHLRASNQLSALLEILNQWNQPHLRAAYHVFSEELAKKLAGERYVESLRAPGSLDRATYPELLVFDFWEQVGTYVKHGLIDEGILLDIVGTQVINAWKRGSPVIEALRVPGDPSVYENFEYLSARSQLWTRSHPDGAYPKRTPRMSDFRTE